MKQMTYEQTLNHLAAYCSRGEKCIWDIRRKMDAWEISIVEQNKIIHYLQQEKFLDESRYCRAFVNDKSQYNRWGAYKIEQELKKKQLPETLIREALGNINSEEHREQLHQLLQNKKKTIKGKTEFEIKQKLMRFAAGRGFLLDDIEKAIDKIITI
jgi:regulatory protein